MHTPYFEQRVRKQLERRRCRSLFAKRGKEGGKSEEQRRPALCAGRGRSKILVNRNHPHPLPLFLVLIPRACEFGDSMIGRASERLAVERLGTLCEG